MNLNASFPSVSGQMLEYQPHRVMQTGCFMPQEYSTEIVEIPAARAEQEEEIKLVEFENVFGVE